MLADLSSSLNNASRPRWPRTDKAPVPALPFARRISFQRTPEIADMALLITDDCTSCDACKPVCPNEAISAGDLVYVIDASRCTECVGAEDEPQCKLVCPADCIEPNPDVKESQAELMAKYHSLHG
jgi:ferredoxin